MDIKHQTNKVAAIAYRRMRVASGVEELQFLVHLPLPKQQGEEEQMMWGIARGTVKAKGADGEWHDIRDRALLTDIPQALIEDHWLTTQQEAWEELGVATSDIMHSHVKDHGLLTYESPNHAPYLLHCYSFPIDGEFCAEERSAQAQDSQKLAWKSLDTLRSMAQPRPESKPNEQFKTGYIAILEQVEKAVAYGI